MLEAISSCVYMYADDTKMAREIRTEIDISILQRDLNYLQEWSSTWQLKFNGSKCKLMHIGSKGNGSVYTMMEGTNSHHLEEVLEEKDLE